MSPKFISGPPGTGKTNMFLTAKYLDSNRAKGLLVF